MVKQNIVFNGYELDKIGIRGLHKFQEEGREVVQLTSPRNFPGNTLRDLEDWVNHDRGRGHAEANYFMIGETKNSRESVGRDAYYSGYGQMRDVSHTSVIFYRISDK